MQKSNFLKILLFELFAPRAVLKTHWRDFARLAAVRLENAGPSKPPNSIVINDAVLVYNMMNCNHRL